MKFASLAPVLLLSSLSLGCGPLKQGFAEAHNKRGIALAQQGKLNAAIAEYRQAPRWKPDHFAPHYNLGTALRHKGDFDGAIAEFRQALRLKPDYAPAHYNLGVALSQKGDLAGALAEFQKAHELAPDSPDIRAAYEKLLKEMKR